MRHKMIVPYLIIVLVFYSFVLFCGCAGSGSDQSVSFWGDNNARVPQVQSIINLNNPGQPIRIGDWCQIEGASFGSSKGNGYVHFTFQDNSGGNADFIYQWSDSQIICRVPQSKKRMHFKAAIAALSISVFTDGGSGSNIYSTDYDPSPNPTPQPTPPSPSPTPSVTPTPSPTSTVSPTPSPTSTISPSPSPTSTGTPSPSPTTWWDMGSPTGGEQQCPNFCFSSTGIAYVSYDNFDEGLNSWMVCFGNYDSLGYHQLASIDVGNDGGFSSLCLNENNIPYLAYCKDANIYVAKYQNGAFTTVGTMNNASAPSIYVSGTYAYLAYEYQEEDETYVTAGFFNDQGVWQGFIRGGFNGAYPKLTGVGNTAYMAFMDCDSLVAGYFPDGNWTILGDFVSPLYCMGVAIDNQDFYVAYLKEQAMKKDGGKERYFSTLDLHAYKNGSWTSYPAIEPSGIINYPYFSGAPAVKNGAVYLAFSELNLPEPTACTYLVKQYQGSSWQDTGNPGFSPAENPNCFINIALGSSGTPYIFCTGPDSNLHLYKYATSKRMRQR